MALRELPDSEDATTSRGPSAVAGLPTFWDTAEIAPKTEWEDWWDLFMVAVNAKYSISVNENLREATAQNPRIAGLINNLNEQAAESKVVSVLFLSLGTAGRKSLTHKFPQIRVATIPHREKRKNCEQAFRKPRKRTLERYKLFSRKQTQKETLRQFWHTLTGMAAKCDFGDQTDSLITDTFIQNMNNKTVQQKRCTEPKENPEEAYRFAIAYEEGVNQHKAFEATTGTKEIKQEPIMNFNRNTCFRCGLEFTQNHLMACKAKNEKCRNCAMIGHFAQMCKRPKTGNIRGRGRMPGTGGLRRINLIEQDDSQSGSSNEMNEENMVLHVSGARNQPFVLKGKINKEPFKTMIDSGSP